MAHPSPELATEPVSPPRRRRGRVMMAVVLIIVVALLIPPFINVNRYRGRVADAIGRALGREVTVSYIELELLPRPGMALSNFVAADDPAFSPEPMLRADKVTAYPRLTSLWRGRLEIGTLELDNPSLNLVRRPDGHWNLEELVERSSRAPSAPTTAHRPESRPRFPYVEATAGRINFKFDQVKKAFALTDADFALWQESEKEWGLRLEARPMRTDIGINDTGTLKVDGRFQRAASLRDTPVNLNVDFSKGQLGQITKLIYGRDRGWRGDTSATAIVSGKPSSLSVTLDAQVDDFRRYDIALGEALRLGVHCTGTYHSPDDSVKSVICESPIAPGTLLISGSAQNWGVDGYRISVRAQQVPMERVIAFARHVKKDLPTDLTALGDAEALFDIRKTDGEPVWTGGGRTSHFALRSSVLKDDLQIGELEFLVPGTPPAHGTRSRRPKRKPAESVSAGFGIVIKPFGLPLGASSPATAAAYFDDTDYRLTVSGEAELARLVNIARALGVATPGVGLAGGADVDLDIAGTWAGFAQPSPAGRLALHKATAELQGISEPLRVESASASLAGQSIQVSGMSAAFEKGPEISGSFSFPLHCIDPQTCILHFDLHANEVTLEGANKLLNPHASQPWYHLLAIGQRREDALLRLRANGTFTITHLDVGMLPAANVSGSMLMDAGKVRINDLRADLLGGRHSGWWQADFTASQPAFTGEGSLTHVAMAQVGTRMTDNWATGILDATYKLAMSGSSADQLRNSAFGTADFSWSGGSLRHVSLDAGHGAPVSFSNFTGSLSAGDGHLALSNGKLQSVTGAYAVSGTAAFDGSIKLQLDHGNGRVYAITGSLEKPLVEAKSTPASQAQLR